MGLGSGRRYRTGTVPRHACLTSSGSGSSTVYQIRCFHQLSALFKVKLAIDVVFPQEFVKG
eukprot:4838344-Amphidinium_carterae.1